MACYRLLLPHQPHLWFISSHGSPVFQQLMLSHFLCIFLRVNEILNKDYEPKGRPVTLRSGRLW